MTECEQNEFQRCFDAMTQAEEKLKIAIEALEYYEEPETE